MCLDDLRTLLQSIRNEEQSWTAVLLPNCDIDGLRVSVHIIFIDHGMVDDNETVWPAHLIFSFPAFIEDVLSWRVAVLVCLHPLVATLVRGGRYLEDGIWKHDELEDWNRFWPPIQRALNLEHGKRASTLSSDRQSDGGGS